MAKQGTVSGSGSASALITAVLPAAIITGTLGSLAQDVLKNKAGNGVVLIDSGLAKVAIWGYTAPIAAAANGLPSDCDFMMRLTPTDASKSSSDYTAEAYIGGQWEPLGRTIGALDAQVSAHIAANESHKMDAFADVFVPEVPVFSGAALINRIADVAKENGKQVLIVVDQQGGIITVGVSNDIASAVGNIGTMQLESTASLAVFTLDYPAAETATSTSIFGI